MTQTNIEDMNAKFVEAELTLFNRIDSIAYTDGKHPDEVYAELMIQFSDFVENKYAPKKTAKKAKTKVSQ
jgi:hypothetical protein